MIAKDLQERWEQLEARKRTNQYDIVLLSKDSHPELFLARSSNAERALVLKVPSFENIDFIDVEGANITLTREAVNRFVVIKLTNNDFKELFDDLVISISNSISNILDEKEYYKVFLRSFYKWLQFFIVLPDPKHKENVIQGIFGELILLQILLTEPNDLDVDTVLKAWRGPYKTSQDFIFENKNIEVKTRKEGNSSVKIANENQLDQADGKELELAVLRLDSEAAPGFTLSHLIKKIRIICEEDFGDISILYEALRQQNLLPSNFSNYDEYVFHPADLTVFNCGLDGFPKLARSALPKEINEVGYSLNTSGLTEFELRKIDYDDS